ncbi:hypothetical protein KR059_011876, partial [Drosophila kikkawai]
MNFNSIYCGNAESNYPTRLGICKRKTWRQRQQARHETQDRRHWREQNQAVIERLSQMVGAWPQDVGDFLYDLTLKKYSHLLNPRDRGWSFCKVPLCYPNVCDRYMGIFDRSGNLRDPTHPKCLHHLLQLLLDHLNGGCYNSCQGLPLHAEYSGGCPPSLRRYRNVVKIHDSEVEGIDEHARESLTWDPGSPLPRKFNIKSKAATIPPPIESQSDLPTSSPRMSIEGPYKRDDPDKAKKQIPRKDLGRYSVFLNDELALAHNRSYFYMENMVNEALERRRNKNSYVGPIGNLRTERLRVLIKTLIEKKGRRVDPQELNRIIDKVDLSHHVEKKRLKQIAIEISTLYSSVVQSNSN